MPRSKTGVVRRKRHKKILRSTKGYYLTRSKLYRRANEAYLKASEYSFIGRKQRKRNFKQLWIIRLNAAVREKGYNYSTFISKLQKSNIELDRKTLSELAVNSPETFNAVLEKVMTNKDTKGSSVKVDITDK